MAIIILCKDCSRPVLFILFHIHFFLSFARSPRCSCTLWPTTSNRAQSSNDQLLLKRSRRKNNKKKKAKHTNKTVNWIEFGDAATVATLFDFPFEWHLLLFFSKLFRILVLNKMKFVCCCYYPYCQFNTIKFLFAFRRFVKWFWPNKVWNELNEFFVFLGRNEEKKTVACFSHLSVTIMISWFYCIVQRLDRYDERIFFFSYGQIVNGQRNITYNQRYFQRWLVTMDI